MSGTDAPLNRRVLSELGADAFGEDLVFNLANVSALADKYCRGCGDYHVIFAARRLAAAAESVEIDRDWMANAVSIAVTRRLKEEQSAQVMVAGAADTGVLAAAVHGVAVLGGDAISRTAFTVLDRCPTPLALCEAYAGRHGLKVTTSAVDLTAAAADRAADVVIVHSLFRHLPLEAHADTLRRFASWLRPNGRIVFSHRIEGEREASTVPGAEREETLRRIRLQVQAGELTLGESLASFEARIERRRSLTGLHLSSYANAEALIALFEQAKLKVVERKILHRSSAVPGAAKRTRLVAVLAR